LQKSWDGLIWILISCLTFENKNDSEEKSQDRDLQFQSQLRDEFKALANDQYASDATKKDLQLSLTSERICRLILNFARHSVNDQNPKRLESTLKLILLLLDQRQLFVNRYKISSFVLFKFNPERQGQVPPFSTESFEKTFELEANQSPEHESQKMELSADLKWLFGELSELLPRILPATSGFSRQAIDFLDSKWLCIQWGCFKLDHLSWTNGYHFYIEVDQQSTTLPAHSVVCAVSQSEDVGHIFDHVWVPLTLDRWMGYTRHFLDKRVPRLAGCIGKTTSSCMVSDKTQNKCIELIDLLQYSAKILKTALKAALMLKGNQSVSRHMLCLPDMGSLKMLQVLVDAPIDVFEAPAVRAAVEGMWSRFRFGFFARFALYVIQLLLFSAFACWSIATNASYRDEDGAVRASFVGGCVAAGICCYFLARELLQCWSCVADGGLMDYVEFWNVLQLFSHTLELTSFAMFVSGSDPISTRLVATYAVFGLWIGLLYFTKAIRQISFLLEILTTIVKDMIPFTFIMAVLIMAVTVALQVLTADLKSKAESNDENSTFSPDDAQSISNFGLLFGFAMRVAEGRQDIAGSALEHLAKAVYEQPDFGPNAMDAFVCTIYFCFYFLVLVITVVALNALIALMGSSYERVMEKKISER
jgi:hypothetical protein